jgi:hypothetical protein
MSGMWRFVEELLFFDILTLKMKMVQSFETSGAAIPQRHSIASQKS